MEKGEDIVVRNPLSTRPYQHVLEPVMAYLMICQKQYEDISFAGNYNVGPDDEDCYTTGELVTLFCDIWKEKTGKTVSWTNRYDGGPHEANFLKLDCTKLKKIFNWRPRWNVKDAIGKIVEWEMAYQNSTIDQTGEILRVMNKQIDDYLRNK